MDRETLRFIDKLYKDLYKSEQVLHHSTGKETEKFRNLEEYMATLERVHNKAAKSDERIKTLKRFYFDKYVIKREEIPDSYYKTQERIALERGFGHITINDDQKRKLQDEVIENQEKSLSEWIDYFLSDDSKFYPFWAKYWAFQGMIKLGTYDKTKGTFNKRTDETVAPFVDLNREALSQSMDLIIKTINKEEIGDRDLEIIVKSGSFQKIYPAVLNKLLSDNQNIARRNEGIWVKYDRGSDYMPLVNSLQGYNTGWCTAGASTASSQLSMGDFYVYYTLDENGEYKVPRVAIRMERDSIGEIRGIGKSQSLEPEMLDVVKEKIKDFPDRDKYYKKVHDMELLTKIYNKHKNGEELSVDELRFIYELEEPIEGFGWHADPRSREIISERKDLIKDLNLIMPENVKGNLNLDALESVEGLKFPKKVEGSVYLRSLKTCKGVVLPQIIGQELCLNKLETAEGLVLPQEIENIAGRILLPSLKKADGVVFPVELWVDLNLNGLETAEGLTLPKKLNGDLYLDSLKSPEGLVLPEELYGGLSLKKLETAEGIVFPENLKHSLLLPELKTTKGLVLPRVVGGRLVLDSLKTAEGLKLPEVVGEGLDLEGLETAEGLELPEVLGGSLYLNSLKSAKGLKLPVRLDGALLLESLKDATGLVLPKVIEYDLDLRLLEEVEELELPEEVGWDINLESLKSVKRLILPKKVGEKNDDGFIDLNLDSLDSTEGLIFPEELTYEIRCNCFTITPENVDEYRKKQGIKIK